MPRFSRDHLLLLLVAAIWGSTFVAQRQAMATMEPFAFNAARFALASVALLPLWWVLERRHRQVSLKRWLRASLVTGTLLFLGFSFQQIGLTETTAANAAFITASYIVFVPLLGWLRGVRPPVSFWPGLVACVAGLYLLSVEGDLEIHRGDLFELIGALFWSAHVIALSHYGRHLPTVGFSAGQFAVAAVFSGLCALLWEHPSLESLARTCIPLLWAGLLSSAVAFTLQIQAMRTVRPMHAVLILSLESVFAALAGALCLEETMTPRQWLGATVVLAGILWAQTREQSRESLALARAEARTPH
ncbi:DMT family transporter [Tepidiphilus margaritifer]|uniref:DMT family transporter n=1 Tax=Tepidiphilus margaritifer TaxID=203471 RepID=UPI000404B880|nr:DMT family transporter [Tepidiphilus margaritifer]